jgi:hypothetical protein
MEATPWNQPTASVPWVITLKQKSGNGGWAWTASAIGYAPLSGTAANRSEAQHACAVACIAATSETSNDYVLSIPAPVE